jgi:hypothetical protein
MITPPVIAADPASPACDWDALVAEGHALLGAMSDGGWTDFNAHDPGITMLEAFAFALTDLGYRAGHAIPDLMAGSGEGAGSRPSADALLAGRAVTRADRAAVVAAVEGVGAAWVEPSAAPILGLRQVGEPSALVAAEAGEDADGEAVALIGVERVVIDRAPSDTLSAADVVRGVASALHRQRNLGEDIDTIEVLAPMPVTVDAEIEIDDPARADAVLHAAHGALAALFEGGAPARGDTAPGRRAMLHLSDAIAALAAIAGVRTVRQVRIGLDGVPERLVRWSLPVPADRVPRFDAPSSRIRLVASGGHAIPTAPPSPVVVRPQPVRTPAAAPSRGRDRRLGDYRPLRYDLPAVFGVAPGTLPPAAGPERRSQAAQLRAYLALLANQFAQLAGIAALLGPHARASYLTQTPDPAGAHAGDRSIHRDDYDAEALQALVEVPDGAASIARRNRLLAHLIARHGEEAPVGLPPPRPDRDAGSDAPGSAHRVLDSRTRFLADIARLTAARGTGADLLDPDDEPALLDRIRLKAGLTVEEGASMRLVEHILLRPLAEDDSAQAMLTDIAARDPYSLQLTLVVDTRLRAGASEDAAALLRVTRAETPAHLVLHILWLDADGFADFDQTYRAWRRTLAATRRAALGFAVVA